MIRKLTALLLVLSFLVGCSSKAENNKTINLGYLPITHALSVFETKEILESALKEYKATLLFISHDRYFINSLATRIIYIEDYKIKTLPGNYNDYKHFKDEKKKGND